MSYLFAQIPFQGRCLLLRCVLLTGLLMSNGTAYAQLSTQVSVAEDQTLRDIARDYLGNPDLWQVIAEFNNIDPLSIQPGDELRIPLQVVSSNEKLLEEVINQISDAGAQGAKIFAEETYQQAIETYNEALRLNRENRRDQANLLLERAVELAEKAALESRNSRVEQQSVVLVEIEGRAQRRKRNSVEWIELSVGDVLSKDELIRTLSNSSAVLEVGFNTIWRMSENSVAMIGNLFKDKLQNKQHAEVGLLEGNLASVLGNLTLNVNDVQFTVKGAMNANRKGDVVALSNQSGEALQIFQGEDSLTFGKGDDLRVEVSNVFEEVLRNTQFIEGLLPETEHKFYNQDYAELSWAANTQARHYVIEVSQDVRFVQAQTQVYRTRALSYQVEGLTSGRYVWRVRMEDAQGIPGPNSKVHSFYIEQDTYPPYLVIHAPAGVSTTASDTVRIEGVTELGAKVLVADAVVEPGNDGRFLLQAPLEWGYNRIEITAQDAAHNLTVRVREVYRFNQEMVAIEFVTPLEQVRQGEQDVWIHPSGNTISGRVPFYMHVELYIPELARSILRVQPDANGFFELELDPAFSAQELKVVAPTGAQRVYDIRLGGDRSPPKMQVLQALPDMTQSASHEFKACFSHTQTVLLHNRPLALNGQCLERRFDLDVGLNIFQISAISPLGVRNTWTLRSTLDRQAPDLVRFRIEPEVHANKQRMRLWVQARDDAELARTARYQLSSARGALNGWMQLDAKSRQYTALIDLSAQRSENAQTQAAPWRLKSIELKDYAGNTSIRSINP